MCGSQGRHLPLRQERVRLLLHCLGPLWRQPRGKYMVCLVISFSNTTSRRLHLREIDLRFAPGLLPGWCICLYRDVRVILKADICPCVNEGCASRLQCIFLLLIMIRIMGECHESRRCSRNTYPESYITKYTSIRRLIIRMILSGCYHHFIYWLAKYFMSVMY